MPATAAFLLAYLVAAAVIQTAAVYEYVAGKSFAKGGRWVPVLAMLCAAAHHTFALAIVAIAAAAPRGRSLRADAVAVLVLTCVNAGLAGILGVGWDSFTDKDGNRDELGWFVTFIVRNSVWVWMGGLVVGGLAVCGLAGCCILPGGAGSGAPPKEKQPLLAGEPAERDFGLDLIDLNSLLD
jgi:hypothetical protein